MTIPLGNAAGSADFAFSSDQATATGGQISSLADTIAALPQQSGAQNGTPNLGSDRVSKAISELLGSQNEAIASGSAHLSGQLHIAAGHFTSSAKDIDETESTSKRSLTALPSSEA